MCKEVGSIQIRAGAMKRTEKRDGETKLLEHVKGTQTYNKKCEIKGIMSGDRGEKVPFEI